jgi:DNA-binding transcriptional regulator YiaG
VRVNVDQDIDSARTGNHSGSPATPHTFILDGHLLRQLRRQRSISQEALADRAGISLTTIVRLERQLRAPCRGWTLGRLAKAVGENPVAMTLQEPSD